MKVCVSIDFAVKLYTSMDFYMKVCVSIDFAVKLYISMDFYVKVCINICWIRFCAVAIVPKRPLSNCA